MYIYLLVLNPIYMYVHICKYVYMYIDKYIYTYVYINTYIEIHICIHICSFWIPSRGSWPMIRCQESNLRPGILQTPVRAEHNRHGIPCLLCWAHFFRLLFALSTIRAQHNRHGIRAQHNRHGNRHAIVRAAAAKQPSLSAGTEGLRSELSLWHPALRPVPCPFCWARMGTWKIAGWGLNAWRGITGQNARRGIWNVMYTYFETSFYICMYICIHTCIFI